MNLAQNLKYLRTKAGKQQKELALILNVSKATMTKYESGMVEPNIETVVRMAEYFGVTLDELVLKDLRPSAPVYVSNLRYLRKKHNITQTEFAKVLGFRGKQSICAIETGDAYISVDNLIKSADYFNVTLDELVKEDLSKEAKKTMTRAQECIYSYIRKNFVMESISLTLIGRDKVKVTDKNGDHMTLTMNLYGDIMDADSGKIYAVSNLPHELEKIGPEAPTDWTEVDR